MQSVDEVRAVPGKGLEGDRYLLRQGTFYKPQPDRELTLIEAEAIEALRTLLASAAAIPSESPAGPGSSWRFTGADSE